MKIKRVGYTIKLIWGRFDITFIPPIEIYISRDTTSCSRGIAIEIGNSWYFKKLEIPKDWEKFGLKTPMAILYEFGPIVIWKKMTKENKN